MTTQDALIMRVSVETGLRTSDVLRLKGRQIEPYTITVRERKTNKIKVSEISKGLYADLCHWAMPRCGVFAGRENYIFTHRNNPAYDNPRKPIERTTFYKRLQRVSRDTGIKVSPHSFRGLYARNEWLRTHDIYAVQSAMNHKYIATTAGYLGIDINSLIMSALET
jgi:integrase